MSRHAAQQFAIGHSDDVDAPDAVAEAARACRERLGGPPTAVILFASIDYDPDEIIAAAALELPGAMVVGCSGDGEMSHERGLCEDSVAMLAFGGDRLTFGTGMTQDYDRDSYAATHKAIEQAMNGRTDPPTAAFTFPSGLHGNADEALRAFRDRFGQDFPVIGGTAGDHWELQRCWSFGDGRWAPDAIPVLLIWGPLVLGTGVESGWTRVGVPLTVTRAEGNTVYEIDGHPAVQAFEAQFGTHIEDSIGELPLAVLTDGDKEAYLRAVYRIDPTNGALVMGAGLPTGSRVSLSNSTHERILAGARRSTSMAIEAMSTDACAVLVISCAARKWLLGYSVQDEIKEIQKGLRDVGIEVPVIGFYSFGEIAPLAGASRFHNETCVVIPLGISS